MAGTQDAAALPQDDLHLGAETLQERLQALHAMLKHGGQQGAKQLARTAKQPKYPGELQATLSQFRTIDRRVKMDTVQGSRESWQSTSSEPDAAAMQRAPPADSPDEDDTVRLDDVSFAQPASPTDSGDYLKEWEQKCKKIQSILPRVAGGILLKQVPANSLQAKPGMVCTRTDSSTRLSCTEAAAAQPPRPDEQPGVHAVCTASVDSSEQPAEQAEHSRVDSVQQGKCASSLPLAATGMGSAEEPRSSRPRPITDDVVAGLPQAQAGRRDQGSDDQLHARTARVGEHQPQPQSSGSSQDASPHLTGSLAGLLASAQSVMDEVATGDAAVGTAAGIELQQSAELHTPAAVSDSQLQPRPPLQPHQSTVTPARSPVTVSTPSPSSHSQQSHSTRSASHVSSGGSIGPTVTPVHPAAMAWSATGSGASADTSSQRAGTQAQGSSSDYSSSISGFTHPPSGVLACISGPLYKRFGYQMAPDVSLPLFTLDLPHEHSLYHSPDHVSDGLTEHLVVGYAEDCDNFSQGSEVDAVPHATGSVSHPHCAWSGSGSVAGEGDPDWELEIARGAAAALAELTPVRAAAMQLPGASPADSGEAGDVDSASSQDGSQVCAVQPGPRTTRAHTHPGHTEVATKASPASQQVVQQGVQGVGRAARTVSGPAVGKGTIGLHTGLNPEAHTGHGPYGGLRPARSTARGGSAASDPTSAPGRARSHPGYSSTARQQPQPDVTRRPLATSSSQSNKGLAQGPRGQAPDSRTGRSAMSSRPPSTASRQSAQRGSAATSAGTPNSGIPAASAAFKSHTRHTSSQKGSDAVARRSASQGVSSAVTISPQLRAESSTRSCIPKPSRQPAGECASGHTSTVSSSQAAHSATVTHTGNSKPSATQQRASKLPSLHSTSAASQPAALRQRSSRACGASQHTGCSSPSRSSVSRSTQADARSCAGSHSPPSAPQCVFSNELFEGGASYTPGGSPPPSSQHGSQSASPGDCEFAASVCKPPAPRPHSVAVSGGPQAEGVPRTGLSSQLSVAGPRAPAELPALACHNPLALDTSQTFSDGSAFSLTASMLAQAGAFQGPTTAPALQAPLGAAGAEAVLANQVLTHSAAASSSRTSHNAQPTEASRCAQPRHSGSPQDAAGSPATDPEWMLPPLPLSHAPASLTTLSAAASGTTTVPRGRSQPVASTTGGLAAHTRRASAQSTGTHGGPGTPGLTQLPAGSLLSQPTPGSATQPPADRGTLTDAALCTPANTRATGQDPEGETEGGSVGRALTTQAGPTVLRRRLSALRDELQVQRDTSTVSDTLLSDELARRLQVEASLRQQLTSSQQQAQALQLQLQQALESQEVLLNEKRAQGQYTMHLQGLLGRLHYQLSGLGPVDSAARNAGEVRQSLARLSSMRQSGFTKSLRPNSLRQSSMRQSSVCVGVRQSVLQRDRDEPAADWRVSHADLSRSVSGWREASSDADPAGQDRTLASLDLAPVQGRTNDLQAQEARLEHMVDILRKEMDTRKAYTQELETALQAAQARIVDLRALEAATAAAVEDEAARTPEDDPLFGLELDGDDLPRLTRTRANQEDTQIWLEQIEARDEVIERQGHEVQELSTQAQYFERAYQDLEAELGAVRIAHQAEISRLQSNYRELEARYQASQRRLADMEMQLAVRMTIPDPSSHPSYSPMQQTPRASLPFGTPCSRAPSHMRSASAMQQTAESWDWHVTHQQQQSPHAHGGVSARSSQAMAGGSVARDEGLYFGPPRPRVTTSTASMFTMQQSRQSMMSWGPHPLHVARSQALPAIPPNRKGTWAGRFLYGHRRAVRIKQASRQRDDSTAANEAQPAPALPWLEKEREANGASHVTVTVGVQEPGTRQEPLQWFER